MKKKIKNPDWRLTTKEKMCYYTGNTGRLVSQAVLLTFMNTFLLFQGIDPLAVAGVTLVVKIIDALDDIIFGFIVDRINLAEMKVLGKFCGDGKYMPWYRLTFWTFPLATILFFMMPVGMPTAGKLVWYAVTYLLYDLTCTLSEVPMSSMIMTLTDNADERTTVLKDSTIFATIFVIILGIGWPLLISEHIGLPVGKVAIASAVVAFFFMLPLAKGVKEHNAVLKNVENSEKKQYSIKDMLRCIKANRYMTIHMIHSIIKLIGGASASVGLFVSFYLFHDSMITTYAGAIAAIPGFILQAFSDKIQKKIGRRNALMYIMLIEEALYFILYFAGYGNIEFVFMVTIATAVFSYPCAVLQNFVIPDTIEYTRYKTGEDCSGIFYAISSFVYKAFTGVASSLGIALMGFFGFQAINAASFSDLEGVVQPQSAMSGMWFLHALFPAVCYLISGLILLLYKLKDKDAQLMARCNSGEITREECEAQLSRKY